MPTYNLRFTDTTKDPIVIFPKSLDGPGANRVHSDLRLYGQGSELWGEGVAEDLLRLLENFASPETGSPPGPANLASPIEGQIWFNQTDDSAYVYRPLGTPQWQRMAQDGEAYTVAEIDTLIALYYNKVESDARYVEVAGDTMTGNLTISKSSPLLILNSTDNTDSRLDFQENGVTIGDVGFSAPGNDITLQRRGGVGSPVAAVTEAISLTSGTGQINVPFKLNAGDPVVDADAARKRYVDDQITAAVSALSSVPAGAMTAFAGSSAPTDWLLCNAAAVSRTTYATLFAVVGTAYGAGDGSTTFNLPDMRGRTAMAQDGGTNRVTNAQGDVLGGSLGTENHTLSTSQVPNHTHGASSNTKGGHTHKILAKFKSTEGDSPDYSFNHVGFAGSTNKSGYISSEGSHSHTITVNSTAGGGGSHNNMQPTLAVNWIIRT